METDINVTFSRMCYNGIVTDLRKAIPGFKSRKYWGYHYYGQSYEVQGPDGFYWYGKASNMWDAKFQAFCQLCDKLGIDFDED